jgi:hypothetical protein
VRHDDRCRQADADHHGGIAEFQRRLIRGRTDAGIKRARRQVKKFGRPERLDDGQKRKIAEFYAAVKTIGACRGIRLWRRHYLEGASTRNQGGGVRANDCDADVGD